MVALELFHSLREMYETTHKMILHKKNIEIHMVGNPIGFKLEDNTLGPIFCNISYCTLFS